MADSAQNSRMDKRRRKNAGGRKKSRSIIKRILAVLGIIGALTVMAAMVYLFTILGTLDDFDPESLDDYEQTSLVYDNQDNLISSIHGIENRIYVPLNQI